MNQNIQQCFSYNGQEFSIVDSQTACILSGSAVMLWNTVSGEKNYIWSKRHGFCAVTANYYTGLIAAAEYGLKPQVHMYESSGRLKKSFEIDTTVKCISMAFSRDGKYLLIIGGVPDFRITIYDTEKDKMLVMEEYKLPCKPEEFLQVKFNPRDNTRFSILSQNILYSFIVHQAYQVIEKPDDKTLMEAERLEVNEFRHDDSEIQFSKFIYDQFDRAHLCTNKNSVIQVDTKSLQVENTLVTTYNPATLVITWCHLIVSQENGLIQWFKVEQPDLLLDNKEKVDQKLKILDEVEKEFTLELSIGETNELEHICHMYYDKMHTQLIMGSSTGIIGRLEVQAEKMDDDEEDEDNQGKKEKQIIQQPFQMLGRFSTKKMTGIKELGETTQVITTSEDHYMTIWEATSGKILSQSYQPSYPTALQVNKDGTIAFIGTQHGVFRIYDIANRAQPRLIEQVRFFEENSPITTLEASFCGQFVVVANKKTQNLYIVSQDAKKNFKVYGYYQFSGYVLSAGFVQQNGLTSIVACLSNNLIVSSIVPLKPLFDRRSPITDEDTMVFYRKVDPGSNVVVCNHITQEIFVTGKDKLLKRYDYPEEKIESIDFKKAPEDPIEEIPSHSIGTNVWAISENFQQVVTGGKDGAIILRTFQNFQRPNEIKAHTLFTGGVTAVAFSNSRSTLYTAGGDGSWMVWRIGANPNPEQAVMLNEYAGRDTEHMESVERVPYDRIQIFQEILEEEFKKDQEESKETFRQTLLVELNQIKDSLHQLLEENEGATEIEQLERDEFVIDTSRRDKIVDEGEKECSEIRDEAQKTVLRLELLRNRVKESTWDKMQSDHQSKAIKSIQSDILIFDYPIRSRETKEERVLNIVKNQRLMEIKEKLKRLEDNTEQLLNEHDFSSFENYIMNRVQGTPEYVDDDAIEQAAELYKVKEEEKRRRKNDQDNMNNQQVAQGNKKQPILKITKGRLGNKTKNRKMDADEEEAMKNNVLSIREIKGMEDMHWRIQQQKQMIEDLRNKIDKQDIFDLLYEPFELYPQVRKRNQIELIKDVVFQLKINFNEEFKALENYKADSIYQIQDKNEQITELLENLHQEEELFEPQGHILENPEHILQTDPSEVKVQKYLTKEERAQVEEEERIKAEREAKLRGDNVQQRGLKKMLGSTELDLKKQKNAMEMDFQMEEWMMTKDEKDFTDEERFKLKEFKQKEKEYKEKQRKAWEQELKKNKQEIIEIQLRFEERLLMLYKKRLFFDVRILEQELYCIRLVIMLHDNKETATDEFKYRQEIEKLENEKNDKITLISTFKHFYGDLERKLLDDQKFRDQEKEIRKIFPDHNTKQLINFVKNGKPKKSALTEELTTKKEALLKEVNEFDPYNVVEKDKINKQIQDEDEVENFDFEKDNIGTLSQEEFEKLCLERETRVQMNIDKDKNENQIKMMQKHITFHEDKYRDIEEGFDQQSIARQKAMDRIKKLGYNFEVIIYLKHGQIEVPQLPVATDYKDAILIQRDIIDYENSEIVKKGKIKIDLMEKIARFKVELRKVSIVKERLDLEIVDFEERAKDVQLYRVTKQTQEIIQGKHQKKDEEDKKRLENQIRQLEKNAEKRIKTINETKMKLKREIREKRLESEQLETKARQLQNQVDQRKQIMSLKSNTMNDNDQDPSKKIKEIAYKRKLLDIAKQQTEEIEVLRDELDRLRARTFPSFAHLHNKPGYPDEN